MTLPRLALRNAQFVVIILLIAILMGVRSFINMPRSEDPQVDFPIYIISVIYPGTSPQDMETLIVDPIEEAVNKVDDITRIKTDIREGVTVISIDAAFGLDTKQKYDDIAREIAAIRDQLPDDIVYLDLEQIKPEDRVNFILLAITSENTPYSNLYDLAEDLKEDLEDISGIKTVDIDASPAEEIRITIDFQRMAAMNMNLRQIVTTLQTNNINVPGGDISSGSRNFTIESTGGYDNIDEIRNTIIGSYNGHIVKLKDVADISKTYEDILWKAEYNKVKCVFVGAKLKRGFNIIAVHKEAMAVIEKHRANLPNSVKMNMAFEQATSVSQRINDFFKNLLQGIALVGIVIFLALGWRAALVIITLIPICVVLSLAILNGSGYALQQISVASLVLALGLLVDNGIVVIENITRFIKEGYARDVAALKGSTEVGMAILTSTITTLLSFFPLTQLGDAPGLFLISLPLTVIYTLIISLILALTFSPIMSKWFLPKVIRRPSIADRFFMWLTNHIYLPILKGSLRWGWLILLFTIMVTWFSISLFPKIGVSFFPTADKPLLLIDIETPIGSNIATTDKAVNYVEQILDTMNIVVNYTSNTGNGNPQVYYNRIPRRSTKSHGQIMVNLTHWETQSFYNTIRSLRQSFATYPGAKITVEELKNAAPVDAPIEILVAGEDLNVLKKIATQIEDLYHSIPGLININNPLSRSQPQIKIVLDKSKAGLIGIDELSFDQTVRASMNGLKIDQVTLDDQESYGLVLRMPFDENPSLEDFNKIFIASRLGGQVPLSHIAKIEFSGGPASFSHYNMDRNVAVTASLVNLDETISTTVSIIDQLDKMDWPRGYSYTVLGEYYEQQNTFGNLGIILLLAQVGIFAVLVLQFRSILQPLIVFAAIPLAISGSFFALYLTGWSFSFFAFVGFISLIGIVVNNSIILVDYINQLRNEGEDALEAIYMASARRLKPILLTTITTILGLIPLTLQGTNQWSPLCWTIIGGMVSSSVLTLVVVPILYKCPGEWWGNVKRIFAT